MAVSGKICKIVTFVQTIRDPANFCSVRQLNMPNLHALPVSTIKFGAKLPLGMPSFADFLTPEDVEALKAYVLTRRAALLAEEAAAATAAGAEAEGAS